MNKTPRPQNMSHITLVGLLCFLAPLTIYILRAPLVSGFMLDETITYWVTGGTIQDTIERAWAYQGQSPLYFIIVWLERSIGFDSESKLRATSLIVMGLSIIPLWYCAKALEINYPLAVLPLAVFCDDIIIRYAMMARPYAWGIFCLITSTALLLHWMSTGKRISFICYPLFLALTLYFQYLFLPVIIIHLLAYFTLRNLHTKGNFSSLVWAWFVTVLLMIPGILHLASWSNRTSLLSQVPLPTAYQAFARLFPLGSLGLPILGCMVGFLNVPFKFKPGRMRILLLLLCWAFGPTLLHYAISIFGNTNTFIDRYYIWRAPGVALLVAYLLNRIDSEKFVKVAIAVWAMFMVPVELFRRYQMDDWQQVAQFINENTAGEILLLNTGLLELDNLPYPDDSTSIAYLSSPFTVYPVENPTILIPLSFEGDNQEYYLKQSIIPKIKNLKSFVLVVAKARRVKYNGQALLSPDYYSEIFGLFDFTSEDRTEIGTVEILKFIRSAKETENRNAPTSSTQKS
jgi:uncharacterized membrane protein